MRSMNRKLRLPILDWNAAVHQQHMWPIFVPRCSNVSETKTCVPSWSVRFSDCDTGDELDSRLGNGNRQARQLALLLLRRREAPTSAGQRVDASMSGLREHATGSSPVAGKRAVQRRLGVAGPKGQCIPRTVFGTVAHREISTVHLWTLRRADLSGDIRQLPPVRQTSLLVEPSPAEQAKRSDDGASAQSRAYAAQGRHLWLDISSVIILTYSRRCSGVLSQILSEMEFGTLSNNSWYSLQKRLLAHPSAKEARQQVRAGDFAGRSCRAGVLRHDVRAGPGSCSVANSNMQQLRTPLSLLRSRLIAARTRRVLASSPAPTTWSCLRLQI